MLELLFAEDFAAAFANELFALEDDLAVVDTDAAETALLTAIVSVIGPNGNGEKDEIHPPRRRHRGWVAYIQVHMRLEHRDAGGRPLQLGFACRPPCRQRNMYKDSASTRHLRPFGAPPTSTTTMAMTMTDMDLREHVSEKNRIRVRQQPQFGGRVASISMPVPLMARCLLMDVGRNEQEWSADRVRALCR